MDKLQIQKYYDDNVDSVEIVESENNLIEGLKEIDTLKGGQVDCLFNVINGRCELSVKCYTCTEKVVVKLMKLGWAYEEGYWIYYV